jgi:hypothetical protein
VIFLSIKHTVLYAIASHSTTMDPDALTPARLKYKLSLRLNSTQKGCGRDEESSQQNRFENQSNNQESDFGREGFRSVGRKSGCSIR